MSEDPLGNLYVAEAIRAIRLDRVEGASVVAQVVPGLVPGRVERADPGLLGPGAGAVAEGGHRAAGCPKAGRLVHGLAAPAPGWRMAHSCRAVDGRRASGTLGS